MCEKVKVEEAAHMIGCSPVFLRYAINQGRLPIGFCVKHDHRTEFCIQKSLLLKYLGISCEEYERRKETWAK